MENLLQHMERAVWGWPLLILLMGAGVFLLFRLRFFPVRMLPYALKLVLHPTGKRKSRVSAFGALCTSLSATIGTGNMVGVATALSLGGPGALFWMEVSAFTGLSLKYAEGLLAVAYRRRMENGAWTGGPFAYISLGLGRKYRLLGKAFAFLGAMAGLCGVGTFVQVGSVSSCLTALISETTHQLHAVQLPWGGRVSVAALCAGILLAGLAARFLFGGMERISRLSAKIVPAMCGLYVLCCVWILIRCSDRIPDAISSVFASVLHPANVSAGFFGSVVAGVSRGIFSNEAGLGTSPIAAAAAEDVTPVEQGLISMTATVFDTFLICTLTGLVVLVTDSAGAGVGATMLAFARGLPFPGTASKGIVFFLLSVFAFTTVIGWSCYGTACLDDLTGSSSIIRKAYLTLYALTAAFAPLCSARGIWTAANVCNGLMAVPNVIALILFSDRIAEFTSNFLDFRKRIRYNGTTYRIRRNINAERTVRHCSKRGEDRTLRQGRGSIRTGENRTS